MRPNLGQTSQSAAQRIVSTGQFAATLRKLMVKIKSAFIFNGIFES
jgi:hypothetical protein